MSSLIIWSGVAVLIRGFTLAMLVFVGYRQYSQMKRKDLYPNEGRLKRLLLLMTVAIGISNFPIIALSYQRIGGIQTSTTLTDIATVTNALSMFFVGALLMLIYGLRD